MLVRERQDFTALWRVRDKALIEALSKPEGQRNATLIESIRKQVADTEGRLAAVAARLAAEFPDYSALASPKPLKAEEVQSSSAQMRRSSSYCGRQRELRLRTDARGFRMENYAARHAGAFGRKSAHFAMGSMSMRSGAD